MSTAMQEWPRRHRITVEQFYRMGEVGLFGPEERVELINGEIVDMPPIGSVHASIQEQLGSMLASALGTRAIVRQQLPLSLGVDSEPQPDIAVVVARDDRYRASHPGAADALLLVEISDSTLRFDHDVKVPLYARHAICEVWVLNVRKQEFFACSAPHDGVYTVVATAAFGERRPVALPDVVIDLSPLA